MAKWFYYIISLVITFNDSPSNQYLFTILSVLTYQYIYKLVNLQNNTRLNQI